MDIIQRTMGFFSGLVDKIKTIGDILRSEFLPTIDESNTGGELFWIFGW